MRPRLPAAPGLGRHRRPPAPRNSWRPRRREAWPLASMGGTLRIAAGTWAREVLRFWLEETAPERWFQNDTAFDQHVRARFCKTHATVASLCHEVCLTDPDTALAAIIVLDQFSRNMFRGTPRAFASDANALSITQKALAKGFAGALSSEEELFLYLPFEHQENVDAQARSVELISALGDPELTKYAQAHKDIVDRFGRFPHRNAILGRTSTAEEMEFLKGQASPF